MDQTFFRTHVYDVSDTPAVKRQKIEEAVFAPALQAATRSFANEARNAMVQHLRVTLSPLIDQYGEAVVLPLALRAATEILVSEVTSAVEKAAPLIRKAIQPQVDALFLAVVD